MSYGQAPQDGNRIQGHLVFRDGKGQGGSPEWRVAFQALGQAAGSLEDTEKAGDDGRTRRVVAFRHWAFTPSSVGRQRGFHDLFVF